MDINSERSTVRLINIKLTKGEEYTDQGQDYYEERYLHHLSQRAEKLGTKLVENELVA